MGRILLVEPERILQQAVILALFPEHEVRVEAGFDLSEPLSIENWDLVIVDGAASKEKGVPSPKVRKLLERTAIPTLWLEEGEGASSAPRGAKLLTVSTPIQREEFFSALSALISPPGRLGGGGPSVLRPARRAKRSKKGKKDASRNAVPPAAAPIDLVEVDEGELIDLVDVVEEN